MEYDTVVCGGTAEKKKEKKSRLKYWLESI